MVFSNIKHTLLFIIFLSSSCSLGNGKSYVKYYGLFPEPELIDTYDFIREFRNELTLEQIASKKYYFKVLLINEIPVSAQSISKDGLPISTYYFDSKGRIIKYTPDITINLERCEWDFSVINTKIQTCYRESGLLKYIEKYYYVGNLPTKLEVFDETKKLDKYVTYDTTNLIYTSHDVKTGKVIKHKLE